VIKLEIKLDIDERRKGVRRIRKVIELLGLKVKYWETYRTNGGWHHYIGVENRLSDLELCLIQALMGSDFKRECFNFLRIRSGKFAGQSWNVLFKRKYEYDIQKGEIKLVSEEVKV
jgi:hypothetical protein